METGGGRAVALQPTLTVTGGLFFLILDVPTFVFILGLNSSGNNGAPTVVVAFQRQSSGWWIRPHMAATEEGEGE